MFYLVEVHLRGGKNATASSDVVAVWAEKPESVQIDKTVEVQRRSWCQRMMRGGVLPGFRAEWWVVDSETRPRDATEAMRLGRRWFTIFELVERARNIMPASALVEEYGEEIADMFIRVTVRDCDGDHRMSWLATLNDDQVSWDLNGHNAADALRELCGGEWKIPGTGGVRVRLAA